MQQFTSGPGAPVELDDPDGPPLSPETVGRGPSMFEASAVPLRSFEMMLADRAQAGAPAEPVELEEVPEVAEVRRLVVRLIGGEELELGDYDDRDGAVDAAQDLIARFSTAETTGEWPDIAGRFVRPASVASIDILVAA
jgi:hypothetical protein